MAITAKLEFRHSQQLVMTPRLQQAIRLLQFSNLELNAFVDAEIERNPLLERDGEDDSVPANGGSHPADASLDRSPATDGDDGPGPSGAPEAEEWLDLSKNTSDPAATLDVDVDNVFPDTAVADLPANHPDSGWAGVRQRRETSEPANLEAFVACEVSLKDHLAEQLRLSLHDPVDRLIGQILIDLVDEAGYLVGDLSQIAARLGALPERVSQVLERLQTFDPAGVFARDLAECLTLQLKEQNRFDPLMEALLANLDLLAQHNLSALRKAVGIDMAELADMIAELKRLDPKPGLRFGSVQVQPVVPDVLVRAASDGSWIVELNTDTLPKVLVNRSYYSRITRSTRSAVDKSYLLNCLQTANWLVKSLDQRARTILRVAGEIVRQQDAFFTYGVQYLRPLNLKTVAEAIGMHESTISRVTSNKYMATPRGLFELKYFFTSAIQAAGSGEAHSSEAVRHRIKQLIEAETAQTVLSDDMIVERLRNDGIDIARRTVAKYRELMRIASSVQRRREKRLSDRVPRAV
jgi:RNA polymerase sigma-54 factor